MYFEKMKLVSMETTLTTAWEYYRKLVLELKSEQSQQTDIGRWTHITNFFGPSCQLQEINARRIAEFRLTLARYSPQTIRHCLSLLRRVIRYAAQIGAYDGPIPKFDMPKFDNERRRFLSKGEAKRLLDCLYMTDNTPNLTWYNIVLLALNTGLRRSEIFNLKPSHFDEENKMLHIIQTKNSTNRTVPLNENALKAIKSQDLSNDYIFLNQDGNKVGSVSPIFERSLYTCKINKKNIDRINKIVFHSLRHTFASWLVMEGIPLIVVKELLGHKTIKMTMRYSHLSPKQHIEAVTKISDMLTPSFDGKLL